MPNDKPTAAQQTIDSVICPACETHFRCQLPQLAQAEGLLRCGVCQQVFNALPQLSSEQRLQLNECQSAIGDSPATAEEPDTEPHHSQTLLAGLSTADHGFDYHQPQPRSRWPWVLLNILAALLLLGQLAHWQRDWLLNEAPLNSSLRDALHRLCATVTACATHDAPEAVVNSGDIVSQKLIVRRHPEVSDALIVDAILLNRSPNSQGFPQLRLRFSDIYGTEIASRLFQPSEYLAGELNALSQLHSQQPVHIALEIVDPGAQAVNYQLELFSHP